MLPKRSPSWTLALLGLALLLAPAAGALQASMGALRVIGHDLDRTENLVTYSAYQLGDPAGLDGRDVNVAIISTGVDNAHPALTGATLAGRDLTSGVSPTGPDTPDCEDPIDLDGAGTTAASIALGRGGADVFHGVAPGAGLVDVRVAVDAAGVTRALVADGIGWVLGLNAGQLASCAPNHPVRVILIPHNFGTPPADGGVLLDAIRAARAQGILVVVPGGDTGPGPNTIQSPGDAVDALTVAAIEHRESANRNEDHVQKESSRGGDGFHKPDLAAPGGNVSVAAPWIVTTSPPPNATRRGSAVAAAHVAGLAAVAIQGLRSAGAEDPRPEDVRDLLASTAEDFGPTGWDGATGAGYADAYRLAVRLLNRPPRLTFMVAPQDPFIGERVVFDASASFDPDAEDLVTGYVWDFGDGQRARTSTPGTEHVYARAGQFAVSVTGTDRWGLAATQGSDVTVAAPPPAALGQPPVVRISAVPFQPLAGQVVHLSGAGSSDADDDIDRYEWDFDHGPGSPFDVEAVGPEVDHTFAADGTVSVGLRVWDANGHRVVQLLELQVFPAPPGPPPPPLVAFTHPRDGDLIAAGETPVFWAMRSGTPSRFVLSVDDRDVGLVSEVHGFVTLAAGNHTLTVRVIDAAGRTSADTILVHVVDPEQLADAGTGDAGDGADAGDADDGGSDTPVPGPFALVIVLGAAGAAWRSSRRGV